MLELYHTAMAEGSTGLLVQCNRTQQQSGKYDCGMFAIALAYHMAAGDNIEQLSLDQSKLRVHLVRCFERKRLSRFPKTKDGVQRSDIRNICIVSYCKCRRPDSWNDMLQCDGCESWFHLKCARLRRAPIGYWYCIDCRK